MARTLRAAVADHAWPAFFLSCLSAWLVLVVWSVDHPSTPALGALSPSFDLEFWRAICAAAPADAALWGVFAMWAVMGAAMMLPTAWPMLAAYRGLTVGRTGADASFAAFIGGYVAVWAAFAGAAALLQTQLAALGALSPHGVSLWPELTATLLLIAGAYQFSALKAACLRSCRAPFAFFLERWRGGVVGAAQMGASHGVICLGCCWALMLLAFVGGTMNLLWMGAAMILMFLEKLPSIGAPLTRPIGAVLILAGLGVAVSAIT